MTQIRPLCIPCIVFLLAAAPTGAAPVPATALAVNDLVITEYLADPVGVSDSAGEYFEIFNATASAIDLTGVIVMDDGSNAFTISGLTVAAGAFAVLSSADGTALGFTPDYIYGSSMALTNADDEIGLYRPDLAVITKVAYTDGDNFGDGIAHELAAVPTAGAGLLTGPAGGTDFVASVTALQLGNFGSPGFAGQTTLPPAAVPTPAALWMFSAALSILCWVRRNMALQAGPRRVGAAGHSDSIDGEPPCHAGDHRTRDHRTRDHGPETGRSTCSSLMPHWLLPHWHAA